MVGPGVVPRHSNFKNLICQTGLSAITGAKGILLRCKTENNHNAQTALRDGDLLSAGVLRSVRNPWALARCDRTGGLEQPNMTLHLQGGIMSKLYGGRWQLVNVSLLGSGGQSEVFRAIDATGQLEGQFALKRVGNPKRHERFRREIDAIKRLSHPNIKTEAFIHARG
jgi:hypothetical protein